MLGHGPGISHAVALRFGRAGFTVAIVARNEPRLHAAAKELNSLGVEAHAFPCDLSDLPAVRALIPAIQAAIGPLTVIHFNAYVFTTSGDMIACDDNENMTVYKVMICSLCAVVREALPDLTAQAGQSAVLVTGGGWSAYDLALNEKMALIPFDGVLSMGVMKAAQKKLTLLLHFKYASRGIFVGECEVADVVKGTFGDDGMATLKPESIAELMWKQYTERREVTTVISSSGGNISTEPPRRRQRSVRVAVIAGLALSTVALLALRRRSLLS